MEIIPCYVPLSWYVFDSVGHAYDAVTDVYENSAQRDANTAHWL